MALRHLAPRDRTKKGGRRTQQPSSRFGVRGKSIKPRSRKHTQVVRLSVPLGIATIWVERSQEKENPKPYQKKMVLLAQNSVTVNSERVIPLPARIQNTNVTADYFDGILNLTLPKSESEKNKVVKVNILGEE